MKMSLHVNEIFKTEKPTAQLSAHPLALPTGSGNNAGFALSERTVDCHKRVLMGVPNCQLTTNFSASCQLTTNFIYLLTFTISQG